MSAIAIINPAALIDRVLNFFYRPPLRRGRFQNHGNFQTAPVMFCVAVLFAAAALIANVQVSNAGETRLLLRSPVSVTGGKSDLKSDGAPVLIRAEQVFASRRLPGDADAGERV